MKFQQEEMSAVLHAFRLPSLHPDIPLNPIISISTVDDSQFVRELLRSKVIQPASIPETAATTIDVLFHGLKSWFDNRTKDLQILQFSIDILDGDKAMNFLSHTNEYDKEKFTGNYTVSIECDGPVYYELESKALELEQITPGLFATALDAIETASYMTIPVMTPNMIYWEFSHCHWEETNSGNEPSDKEARKDLLERLGECEALDNYLPSVVIPLFGGNLCLSDLKKKRKILSTNQLKRLSKTALAADISNQIISLQRAIEIAKKNNASLPDTNNLDVRPVSFGCSLIFKENDQVIESIDNLINDAYQAGDATDVVGFQELPTTYRELKRYFAKLHLAFNVVREMDKLLAMIATPIELGQS